MPNLLSNKTRHHPSSALFADFTAGELTMGMSLAVAAHIATCSSCQRRASASQEAHSSQWYAEEQPSKNFDHILDSILSSEPVEQVAESAAPISESETEPKQFEFFGLEIQVPPNLARLLDQGVEWKEIGKGIHSALLDVDKETKCELVHMVPGAAVPRHSHRGSEAMFMLSGSICDDWDCYSNNDFVVRGPDDNHAQVTEEGCICLFVTDGALHFTEGMARLLNPINDLWFFFRRLWR